MKKLFVLTLTFALLALMLTACSTGFVRSTTTPTEAPAATATPTAAPTAQPTAAAEVEPTQAPAN